MKVPVGEALSDSYLPRRRRTPHPPPTMLTLLPRSRPIPAFQLSSSTRRRSLWRVCHPFGLGVSRRHSPGRWRTLPDQRRGGSTASFRLPCTADGRPTRVVPSWMRTTPQQLFRVSCVSATCPLCRSRSRQAKGPSADASFTPERGQNETSSTRHR